MSNRAAIIASRILKKAYGGPVLFFNHDGSFAKLFAEGETVRPGGDIAAAVDEIYKDRLPDTITLRTGSEPEHPGQRRLFDTGEDDERIKSVRERPKSHTTVLSVSQAGGGIHLTVVSSDSQLAESDEFLESVMDELRDKDVHPPWETGEGLAETVNAHLDYGSDIPSEFYEDRYNWDDLVEPHNEFWATEFKDDVRRAIEKLFDSDEIGGSFPGESIGGVVAALVTEGTSSVISPNEMADNLADEFSGYEEHGQDSINEIVSPILDEIRETWKDRQLMRQDNKTFDVMREALDSPIDLPPNSDAVLRMLGMFKERGWEAISFRDMAKEFPNIAGQERFWKAIAKGSPKLTPDRLQAYLDGKNPKATEMLPKSFGGKAVNPPKYEMVAEDDYEGYTISNVDEHMLGVAALYVKDFNEEDVKTELLIMAAMQKWHSSAHPMGDDEKGIGWIRYDLIQDEDDKSVMFIQEIQSDFMWAIELAAAGKTPSLGGGFPESWGEAALGEIVREQGELVEITPESNKAAVNNFNKKLAQYILKKFQGWDHYLIGNLMTTARQNGVDKVVMNTSKTIKLNPRSAPTAEKKLRWYDDLARNFGFRQEQVEMYGHNEEFHSRAAGRMAYHRARFLIARIQPQSQR